MAQVDFSNIEKMIKNQIADIFKQYEEKHQLELTEAYESGYNDAMQVCEEERRRNEDSSD